MNIEKRENHELINRFVELSSLIDGKNNLEKEVNKLEDSIKKVEVETKEHMDRFYRTLNKFTNAIDLDDMIYLRMGSYLDLYSEYDSFVMSDFIGVLENEFYSLQNKVKEKYDDIIKNLPIINKKEAYRDNYCRLGMLIFRKQNENLYEEYKKLREKILNNINQYDFTLKISKNVDVDDYEVVKSMTSIININNIPYSKSELEATNIKIISDMYNRIEKITTDIEKEFIKVIPNKYIYNENFRNYAIECLFYERCKTVGEVLNLYENLELHTQTNFAINEVLNSLDNVHAMQFNQLMKLNKAVSNIEGSLDSIEWGMSDLNSNIEDVSYTNANIQNDLIESNRELNRQIQASNSLASEQLDKLTNIDRGSRKIGKDIMEVKGFTERYRTAKGIEGKYYY